VIIFLVCENTNLDSEKFLNLFSYSIYDVLNNEKHIPKSCKKILNDCANETQFIHKDYRNTKNLFQLIMDREREKLEKRKSSSILNRIGIYFRIFYYDYKKETLIYKKSYLK
jgi:hypothetical protein